MKGFYNVTDKIKTLLEAEPFVNTVTFGSIDDVDLDKQSIFPLSHVIVNNAVVGTKTTSFSISILAMDLVDISNDEVTDVFVGNDNEQDVLNTQLAVINKLIGVLRGGALYTTKYQLDGDPSCEPFYDRFENQVAGFACTFDVLIENDINICS